MALGGASAPARSQAIAADLLPHLTQPQIEAYGAFLKARAAYERQLDAYWAVCDERREGRRKKRAQSIPFTPDDYVAQHPPRYVGPPMPPDVTRIIVKLRPPQPVVSGPRVADFLHHARALYGFVPGAIPEREFKRRYAEESLAVGLTKTHVVRVYALETGGRGKFDMLAGIDPDTGQGRPISSALGYAQLLHANSVSELVRYGDYFIKRLEAIAAVPGTNHHRIVEIRHKIAVLQRMLRAARTVPNEWSAHMRFAATPHGLGIHALNLDGDIGPWLQVIKLRGLMIDAQRAGRTSLSGAELELMNLAGPRTGLEMMEPIGAQMPTANFFARNGYNRNPIVHDRTARELLLKLDERMDVQMTKHGSIEFSAVFDEVMRRRQTQGAAEKAGPAYVPIPGPAVVPMAAPALARRPGPRQEIPLHPGTAIPAELFRNQ